VRWLVGVAGFGYRRDFFVPFALWLADRFLQD
jgi:hypothetical protein